MDPAAAISLLEMLTAHNTVVIRTDFTDDATWAQLRRELMRPRNIDDPHGDPGDDAIVPDYRVFEDREFEGTTSASLAEMVNASTARGYAVLADAQSIREAREGADATIEYVNLTVPDREFADDPREAVGRTFRCAVPAVASVAINLWIVNMSFYDFADAADTFGVYRS